jgi:hypothetical protein
MLRAALTVVGIATIIVVLIAPTAIAAVGGRPLSVDCGGRDPPVCEEGWRALAGDANWLPATWVVVEPHGRSDGTCGDYTIGRWWPFFDPLATFYRLCN